jgi:hypothetical protein
MNYGIIENPILDISKFTDISVLYLMIEITLVKSNAKSDEGIFLGYFSNSKVYRVFNKRTVVVDDIIFGSTNENLCKEFSKTMQDEFKISIMGELKFSLGFQIKQTEGGIFLNQSKYVIDLLKRFGLENAKAYGSPIGPSTKLDKDEKGKTVDVKLYRGMISNLLYLTASRPEIMFSLCLCARFQSCLKESHLITVK